MPHKRTFLDWDEPVVDKVCNYLLETVEKEKDQPLDLEGVLIVVPTAQAGRRLREALALKCSKDDTVLLSANIVPTSYLFNSRNKNDIASESISLAVMTSILRDTDACEKYPELFSEQLHESSFGSLYSTALMINGLRKDLSGGGFKINDVIEKLDAELKEPERWADLQKFEAEYLERLKVIGLSDLVFSKLEAANSPELDESIERIVVACVPDPSHLALNALKAVSERIQVDILVFAAKSEADMFDEWGRPRQEAWLSSNLNISDESIHLESSPASQSLRVVKEIEKQQDKFGVGDIAIGVPDNSVVQFIESDLGTNGISVFDPADKPFVSHPLYRLLSSLSELLETDDINSFSSFIRHPDTLKWLKNSYELEPEELLNELDEFKMAYLPMNLADITDKLAEQDSALNTAVKAIRSELDKFSGSLLSSSLQVFLKNFYGWRRIDPKVKTDSDFTEACSAINDVLHECSDIEQRIESLKTKEIWSIFLARLSEEKMDRNRNNADIDLEGWLELFWNNAPHMLISGMNDEHVPGTSLADAFMPDTMKARLDLRSDNERLARDIYITRSLMESRKANGHVAFVLGKRNLRGDPLRPSRILFRCASDKLAQRTEHLFQDAREIRPDKPATMLFKFNPNDAEPNKKALESKRISVTALRDYLECPFRYYLGRVLKMDEPDYGKCEPDALDFGIIVHTALEAMGNDKKLWNNRDHTQLAVALQEIAVTETEKIYGKNLPLSVKSALYSARQRLAALAVEQVALAEEGWKPIEVEKKNVFKCCGFDVVGKIDRIDQRGDIIRIIDYKTSDKAAKPALAHLRARRDDMPEYNFFDTGKGKGKAWKDLQLPVYHMLYTGTESFDENIQLAYFNLPEAVSETGLYVWKDFSSAHLESAIKALKGVLDGISKQAFWPPSDGPIQYDDFEDLFMAETEECLEELKK